MKVSSDVGQIKNEQKPEISEPKNFYVNYIKKVIDIFLATLLFTLLFPLLIIIYLLIKNDSEGPIVFKQERYGLNGKLFNIYKFRTMFVNVPKQGVSPTESSDPRITKIGHILRKTSLDELPQLLNIIRGEMSFIGPRPEQKVIVEELYTNFEKKRFLIKPGITGLWQVSPYRTKPIHENISYDFHYIQNVSFMLDLKIIIKTLKIIIYSNTH